MTTDPTATNPQPAARRNRVLAGLAAIAVLTVGLASSSFATHDFPDVPASNPFHDDISWLADAGVTEGFPDGGFHPTDPVSRQSMAAFLRRLAGADPAVDPIVDAATLDGRTAQQLSTPAFYNATSPDIVIPDGGGSVNVMTLSLPAGTYQVDFTARITSTEAGSTVVCGPPGIDSPFIDALVGTGAGYVRTEMVTGTGIFTMASAGTWTFACYKPAGGGAGDSRINLARAYAIQVDTLTLSP
jgi:hypothetical protein